MLQLINDLDPTVVGVKALGEITKDDYEQVLLPAVEKVVNTYNELSMLMVLETDIQNFTPAAWMRDAWMSLKNYTRWNKVAIVTEQRAVERFSDMLRYLFPGEAKGFSFDELEQAIEWVGAKKEA